MHMTKIGRSLLTVLALSIMVAGMSGCQKKEGPMERAGKEIDKAAEKTGKEIEKALEKTGKDLEKAGEKIKESAKDVKK